MHSKPAISVIVATYNHADYISQTLSSLRGQTLPRDKFEVVVVNDGSTDNTSTILSQHSGEIRVIEQTNQGLVAACNRGLISAEGQYFARLDSDDFVDTTWLENLYVVIRQHSNAVCVYPDYLEIKGYEETYVDVSADNLYTFQACGPLFHTQQIRDVGGFRNFYWEEYDLYLRLKRLGDFIHVPRPLYMYRRHQANMTGNKERRLEGWRELTAVWGADVLRAAGRAPELEEALQSGS